jgi:hypothetical protein
MIYLFFCLISLQSLGAQTPLHQATLPSSSPQQQKMKLVVLFSEIPAKNRPVHFYGAKGKFFMKVGEEVKVVGTLEHSYEIPFGAKKTTWGYG